MAVSALNKEGIAEFWQPSKRHRDALAHHRRIGREKRRHQACAWMGN